MTNTPLLNIPTVQASQNQKEVTINAGLYLSDIMMAGGVNSQGDTTPPVSPSPGDAYIVGASATGAWAGQDDNIAYYVTGWNFIPVREGMSFWVKDEDKQYRYITSWAEVAGGGGGPAIDDGNWTPDLQFGGGKVGITYSTQVGRYYAVGDLVYVALVVILSNKGSSTGTAKIFGLPHASRANGANSAMSIYLDNMSAGTVDQAACFVEQNSSNMKMFRYTAGTGPEINEGDFTNTSLLIITGNYLKA